MVYGLFLIDFPNIANESKIYPVQKITLNNLIFNGRKLSISG